MTAVLTPPLPTKVVSTPPATPPAVQAPPQPFRWTLKDYHDLAKTGFLDDKRTMLLDGVLYVMPNPDPPHDIALGQTDDWLRTVFAAPNHHVRCQMSFDVGEDTDPGPDLAVVVGSRKDYLTGAPRAAVLIVEVADSSLFYDTTTKAEKYATAQVPDYWVIDLENRQLIVFRDPAPLPASLGANAYRQRNTYGPDAIVAPLAAPDSSVKVADLLP
jgi:Uma2 family endonuclease